MEKLLRNSSEFLRELTKQLFQIKIPTNTNYQKPTKLIRKALLHTACFFLFIKTYTERAKRVEVLKFLERGVSYNKLIEKFEI